MHVAIDARSWRWTGVGRYIRSLIREYTELAHDHTFTLLIPRDADIVREVQDLTSTNPDRFIIHPVSSSYYSIWEQLQFPFILNRIRADLFHFPHFNVPLLFNRPFVTTIHDVTRFYFPGQKHQGLLRQLGYEAVFGHAVLSARQVIAVSEYTRSELLHLYPEVQSRTQVIQEGVDERFSVPASGQYMEDIKEILRTEDPYILVVGVWMSHKNLPRVVQAFKQVVAKHPTMKLVITGEYKDGYVDVRTLVNELGIRDSVLFPGFVPHELLPALYQGSQMLVFASLYEGFGLPALEAAAAGIPVVASNVTSLPEVMDGAARYVNPEYSESIAAGIMDVLRDSDVRQGLITQGKERIKQFSWRACAEKTLQIYED